MKAMRIVLASTALAALLAVGAVVALAAPGALRHAASPKGGAARSVYCPPGLKKQMAASLRAYKRRVPGDRARYFRTHKQVKQRTAFVRLQTNQLHALQKKLRRCD